MRLHRLTMTAFGPFAGTETVDFDALAAAGLFLFTGPTGAGKTSVLDAVCFALYGQVPGARQGARSLRSDHAAPGVAPEVVLDVTIRGRRLRVSRSPAWERPKLRGSGTMLAQAKVLVQERCGEEWVTRSSRLDEAGQLLGGLLGLSMAQFCQVVLLPQGQFADFLRADADRRRALLETLFDTRRFSAVESWLVARRQETARLLSGVDEELGQLLARVSEVAQAPSAELPALEAATGWVDELLARARAELVGATRTREQSEAAHTQAMAAVAEATRVVELQARAEQLRARAAELATRGAEHATRVSRLDQARRVAPLLPLLERSDELRTSVARLEAVVETGLGEHARTLRQATPMPAAATGTGGPGDATPFDADAHRADGPASATAGPADPAELSAAEVTSVARRLRDEAAGLRIAEEHEAEIVRICRDIDQRTARIGDLQELLAAATAWLDSAALREEQLRAELRQAQQAAVDLAAAQARRERANAALAAAGRRDALATVVAAAADEVRRLTDAHQAARDAELEIRAARLRGMAAELAAGLAEDAPCPVCGSAEHPQPATGTGQVSLAEEESAVERTAAAESARRAAEDRLAALRAELAAERSLAGGDASLGKLQRLAEEAAAAERALTAVASRRQVAEQALADFAVQRDHRMRDQVAAEAELAQARATLEAERARLDELQAEVHRARAGDPSVAARRARLAALADDIDELAAAMAEAERLRGELAEADRRVRRELVRLELPSPPAARAVACTEAELSELAEACRTYDTELATVREQLADPALVAAADAPEPDLPQLSAVAAQADADRTAAGGAEQAARHRVTALTRLRGLVADCQRRRDPLAAEHRVVDGLSRLAEGKSGDNHLRMSLSGYVLAARLEQVAACASQRLERMSSGRYTLVHSAEAGGGRGRGGLALRVLDAWTGQERDPATLSGGETFSASLALALGLADVVTAEAGGALLETLFVDEGFGTLDDDTLDEVMSVLDDLREGGRTVGIVSHVADLRQRVPTQLRIRKGRAGSTISDSAGAVPAA